MNFYREIEQVFNACSNKHNHAELREEYFTSKFSVQWLSKRKSGKVQRN